MCVFVYMYVCIQCICNIYLCVCMYVCIYVCVYMCVYVSVYMHVYVYLCICVCVCINILCKLDNREPRLEVSLQVHGVIGHHLKLDNDSVIGLRH